MSRSPRCDISTEISLGTKYTTVHIATNILAKVVEAETETVVQPHRCKVLGGNLCGREDKSCANTRLGQKPRSQLLQTRCLKIFSAVIGDEFSQQKDYNAACLNIYT